ncbi:MAG: type RNA-guided endonuclease Cas9 [Bacteroidota bacterium]
MYRFYLILQNKIKFMANKRILGLDLGVGSIGWALVSEGEVGNQIEAMGSRIVSLSSDDKTEFSSGNKISKNQNRTAKRTQRKGYDRYQLRRKNLTAFLVENEMLDPLLFSCERLNLWSLRARAVSEQISLTELGRVLYHLNQKRGYKSARIAATQDKNETDYVANVKSRHAHIKEIGLTIGQYFFNNLIENEHYRIKAQVFPREAYLEEFDTIMARQSEFYPDVLTSDKVDMLRNQIIYYQRKLKSQKGLVSVCDFEGFTTRLIEGEAGKIKERLVGPKVAPKSSPLFQYCRIWELVNNLSLKVLNKETKGNKWLDYFIPLKKKKELVQILFKNKELSKAELLKILGLKKDEVQNNKQIERGLKGNFVFDNLHKIIGDSDHLNFNIEIVPSNHDAILFDRKTGEIIERNNPEQISANIVNEPLYQLWHTIYSIKEADECIKVLKSKYGFSQEVSEQLAALDFNSQGFGNKSAKAMRKIIPYLMQGYHYAHACCFAGYFHSDSQTRSERESRVLAERLELLPKNSLRQPVVEKILNQMINVVNAIIDQYGRPDEIRIELARQLKQSIDERNEAEKNNKAKEKLNKEIINRLSEFKLPGTKKNIQKYKFIFPVRDVKNREAQVATQCIYCGISFSLSEAITGDNFDVDHIVPRSLLFDDSQTNKVLVHRACNTQKNNQTAYDFIRSKSSEALETYLRRVDDWYERGIFSYTKMHRLKVSYEDYLERKKVKKETEADKRLWENFIERQLRQTQYISRKATEILQQVATEITVTEGGITATLRRLWGLDDVLMNLHLPKYLELEKKSDISFTEEVIWTSDNGKKQHRKTVIKDWSKRNDHRHHAIDALVVASTKQGFIQRINTLNSSSVRDEMNRSISGSKEVYEQRLSLLEKYLAAQKPFSTEEVERKASETLVSYKSGKKVATLGVRMIKQGGKNQVAQKDIVVPRGKLSDETVYGRIKAISTAKPLSYLFANADSIVKSNIRKLVEDRLKICDGDVKKALSSVKKDPIYVDQKKQKMLTHASCYEHHYVVKYPVSSLKPSDLVSIVDKGLKDIVEKRFAEFPGKEKEAFKTPLFFPNKPHVKISSVRCFTGLNDKSTKPVKFDHAARPIGFSVPGNNHHVAIYMDSEGKKIEHICTFWDAVERKKNKLPVVIKNPSAVWDLILYGQQKLPDDLLNKLPDASWSYIESIQQNEMFLLGLEPDAAQEAISAGNNKILSTHLYRVQKLASADYWFRHHLETEIDDSVASKASRRFYRIASISSFLNLHPIKIRLDCLGHLVK